MPTLDRLITVRRAAYSRDSHGESTSVNVDTEIWATRRDASAVDHPDEGGERDVDRLVYIVRWTADLASAPASGLTVLEGQESWSVDSLREESGERSERRRFLRLECLGERAGVNA